MTCEIGASTDFFDDHCDGVRKYLRVEYDCEDMTEYKAYIAQEHHTFK